MWILNTAQGSLNINFEIVRQRFNSVKSIDKSKTEETILKIKVLFIEAVSIYRNKNLIRSIFFGIYKTFYFLIIEKKSYLTIQSLERYYKFILMRAIQDSDLVKSSKPIYLHRSAHDLCRWNRILLKSGFTKIHENGVNNNLIQKALKESIHTLTSDTLTYNDWQSGYGLNTLTLDFGAYYIDHCATFFDQNIDIAIVLNSVLLEGFEITKSLWPSMRYTTYCSDYRLKIIESLQGVASDDMFTPVRNRNLSIKRIDALKRKVLKKYKVEIKKRQIYKYATSKKIINFLEKAFEVTLSDYQINLTTQIIKLSLDGLKIPPSIERAILDVYPDCQDIRALIRLVQEFADKSLKDSDVSLPSTNYFKDIGCISSSKKYESYIADFLYKVRVSGQILSMAYTGWRGSELGFSKSSICIDLNLDILEQSHTPIRYKIDHTVPKTHGDVKLKREITQKIYNIAIDLSELNNNVEKGPCLINFGSQFIVNTNSIAESYKRHTIEMWQHFAHFYKPFINLKEELNKHKNDKEKLESVKFQNLYRAYKRIHSELEISNLISTRSKGGVAKALKEGTLSNNAFKLINSRLPQRALSAVLEPSSDLGAKKYASRRLGNEISRTLLKPTPHAFRHMWAEAVYRRFDGDVGWAIRSNFKHISNNMWLAYIKDKNYQNQSQKIKSAVISSLLKNYISKRGEGYEGAIDTALRRLISQTKITDIDKLSFYSDKFANQEIEDIKSTAWGFCLLRSRHQSSAKCAEHGVPQRSKASPSLCLGCVNNLAMTSSVEGILLSTANDIKVIASKDERMPSSYKRASYKTVKLALSYLKKLNANKNVIQSYQKALKNQEK